MREQKQQATQDGDSSQCCGVINELEQYLLRASIDRKDHPLDCCHKWCGCVSLSQFVVEDYPSDTG